MYLAKLKSVMRDLTYSEELLANYINEHTDEIDNLTSTDLARICGVSQSTVIRFSQKLGYESYKKMTLDISTQQSDENIDINIDPNEDTNTTIEKLKSQYDYILNLTYSLNSIHNIDYAVELLHQAKRIVCFGFSARNNLFAQYFSEKLLVMGKDSKYELYPALVYSDIEQLEENDVLVLFSESGETRDLVNYAKLAREKKVQVISITRVQKNKLQSLSDCSLKIVEYGGRTALRSNLIRYSILIIIDTLYLNLIKKEYDHAEKLLVKHRIETKLNYKA